MNGTKYEELATEIGRIVAEKNQAYGSSFDRSGEILAVLYPDGIRPDQYVDALGVVRVLDKLFRIATDKDALGESPWRDIAGYGILGAARSQASSEDVIASQAIRNIASNYPPEDD